MEVYPFTVLEAGCQKSRWLLACTPPPGSRGKSFLPFSSLWWLLASPDLGHALQPLPLWSRGRCSLLAPPQLSLCLSFVRTLVLGCGAHADDPGGSPRLSILTVCRDPFSKQGRRPRFWAEDMDTPLGVIGTTTTIITPTLCLFGVLLFL